MQPVIHLDRPIQDSHIMLYVAHLTMSGIQTHDLVVIGTNCRGSCKSNYHTIKTMMAPNGTRNIYIKYLLCPPNEVWETYCVCSVSYYSSSSFFLPSKVCPIHFLATTERKSMKLHRNVKHYEYMCRLLSEFSI